MRSSSEQDSFRASIHHGDPLNRFDQVGNLRGQHDRLIYKQSFVDDGSIRHVFFCTWSDFVPALDVNNLAKPFGFVTLVLLQSSFDLFYYFDLIVEYGDKGLLGRVRYLAFK